MGSFDDVGEIYNDDNLSFSIYSSEIGKKHALVIDDHPYFINKRKARKLIDVLEKTFKIPRQEKEPLKQ
jgi:hypothetical protein